MNLVKVKVKDWLKRLNLWKHKLDYSIYQNPTEALMYFILACLFIMQVVIIVNLSRQ